KLKRPKESRPNLGEYRDAVRMIHHKYRKNKIAIHPITKRPGMPSSSAILPSPPSAAPAVHPPPPKSCTPWVPTPSPAPNMPKPSYAHVIGPMPNSTKRDGAYRKTL